MKYKSLENSPYIFPASLRIFFWRVELTSLKKAPSTAPTRTQDILLFLAPTHKIMNFLSFAEAITDKKFFKLDASWNEHKKQIKIGDKSPYSIEV